jgi:hypothetical protein
MHWLHDLHSDDMILLGSVSVITGLISGALARLAFARVRRRKTL